MLAQVIKAELINISVYRIPPLDSEGFQKNIKNIYEKPKKIYNGL